MLPKPEQIDYTDFGLDEKVFREVSELVADLEEVNKRLEKRLARNKMILLGLKGMVRT